MVAREGKAAVRAEREAKTAAHLRHPACLRAYGFGHDSRHVYIAYEFVPGQTYREALRAGQLTDDDAVEACAQVCDGLAHAHAAGILHRDVKPSNVLLDRSEHVYLADFGLTRRLDDQPGDPAEERSIGTPAYLAPEQLDDQSVDARADVYALGCLLYECLT
jgi:serine/threonine-protein kinase